MWRTQGAFTEIDSSRPNARNQLMQTRPIDTGACLPLAVTFAKAPPRSRMVVGCTDNTVRVMGPGGNDIATASGHTDWVYAVATSPDGSRLASGSGDGTMKIWGPAGRLLRTLGNEATPSTLEPVQPVLGWIYPAGGQRGTTIEVTASGTSIVPQTVLVSGGGVGKVSMAAHRTR